MIGSHERMVQADKLPPSTLAGYYGVEINPGYTGCAAHRGNLRAVPGTTTRLGSTALDVVVRRDRCPVDVERTK
jgi:hypothetical protein